MFAGTRASAGHHWPGECRVDFTGMDLERIIHGATELEDAVNWDIKKGVSFRIVGPPTLARRLASVTTVPSHVAECTYLRPRPVLPTPGSGQVEG